MIKWHQQESPHNKSRCTHAVQESAPLKGQLRALAPSHSSGFSLQIFQLAPFYMSGLLHKIPHHSQICIIYSYSHSSCIYNIRGRVGQCHYNCRVEISFDHNFSSITSNCRELLFLWSRGMGSDFTVNFISTATIITSTVKIPL